MADSAQLLSSVQMAEFVATGFLRFDAVVPEDVNAAAMAEMDAGRKQVKAGTPLAQAYPAGSAIGRMLDLPVVKGAWHSLVGADATFHNHDIHIRRNDGGGAQPLHADQIVDTRERRGSKHAFDVTLMYYPHDITLDMGGTLIVPGSHLRSVSGADIGRYQNLRGQIRLTCSAGTVLLLHHGIWHCGRRNAGDRARYMFRVRIHPEVRQVRLWDVDGDHGHDDGQVQQILMQRFPWYELADARLDMTKRVKLWAVLTGVDAA